MDIIVIGAGYAGMTAALRLDRRHRITLVSATDHFTERVRLHELAAGRPSVSTPLAELTRGTGIHLVTGRVTELDPAGKRIVLEDGRELGYDTLIYALGSFTDTSVPGVAEHAYTAEDADKLAVRLRAGGGRLTVVGGGLTGVELATELAETYPDWRVGLVAGGRPVPGLSRRGRAHVDGTLARLGVEVTMGTRAEAVTPGGLRTSRGEIAADVVVWAGSFAVSGVARRAGLAVDERGRALVDETMRSVSHPDVYVVGDAAAVNVPRAGVSRMSCAIGMPIAAHAADAVNARARGRAAAPFRFRYLVQCVSLGRRDGVIQAVRRDDAPIELVLPGRLGAWVKELVCRYAFVSVRLARRLPRSYVWPR
ncbi:NAD(P)/FAD-dependent oxidoreductase [Nonomuraea typhae]|uniref:NAD(P)/FAD-dependent oxidoreductase n=1 Tax=Nonomuraea typhae TaxID=2603600 RepID=UPI0012FA3387|nr:FAD-dependent oxidoreductase [Nonomuraea typhae]